MKWQSKAIKKIRSIRAGIWVKHQTFCEKQRKNERAYSPRDTRQSKRSPLPNSAYARPYRDEAFAGIRRYFRQTDDENRRWGVVSALSSPRKHSRRRPGSGVWRRQPGTRWLADGLAITGQPAQALIPQSVCPGILVLFTASARWWQAWISHDLAFALIDKLQMGIYDGLERAAPGGSGE